MPDVSGASAVKTGVHTQLTICAHQAAGALGTGIPRALCYLRARDLWQGSGAMRGENADACSVIVRSALAMTLVQRRLLFDSLQVDKAAGAHAVRAPTIPASGGHGTRCAFTPPYGSAFQSALFEIGIDDHS
jgi:hypothetical protein